jgi:hypothetical protein
MRPSLRRHILKQQRMNYVHEQSYSMTTCYSDHDIMNVGACMSRRGKSDPLDVGLVGHLTSMIPVELRNIARSNEHPFNIMLSMHDRCARSAFL